MEGGGELSGWTLGNCLGGSGAAALQQTGMPGRLRSQKQGSPQRGMESGGQNGLGVVVRCSGRKGEMVGKPCSHRMDSHLALAAKLRASGFTVFWTSVSQSVEWEH